MSRVVDPVASGAPSKSSNARSSVGVVLSAIRSNGAAANGVPKSPERDQYEELLKTVRTDLHLLKPVNAVAAEKIQQIVDGAGKHAAGGEFAKANQFLSAAAGAVAKARAAASAAGAKEAVPEGKVSLERLRLELNTARTQAGAAVGALEATLRDTGHETFLEVADHLGDLARSFPAEVEGTLAKLEAAVLAGDTAAAEGLRAKVREGVQGWLAFLQENAASIRGCEGNPFGVTVAIAGPIRQTLNAILSAAA